MVVMRYRKQWSEPVYKYTGSIIRCIRRRWAGEIRESILHCKGCKYIGHRATFINGFRTMMTLLKVLCIVCEHPNTMNSIGIALLNTDSFK